MSDLITRQTQSKAARAHAEQIARLERERDAAIKVCEMNATSGAFNARWAENAQKRAEALEAQNARLLDAADKAISGDLKPLANLVREIRSGVRWEAQP